MSDWNREQGLGERIQVDWRAEIDKLQYDNAVMLHALRTCVEALALQEMRENETVHVSQGAMSAVMRDALAIGRRAIGAGR